jgi:hypothetical protein
MDLFNGTLPVPPTKKITDYVAANDIKGLVLFLKSLSQQAFIENVLRAGYSMISFSNGKNIVIENVINQIKIKQ